MHRTHIGRPSVKVALWRCLLSTLGECNAAKVVALSALLMLLLCLLLLLLLPPGTF